MSIEIPNDDNDNEQFISPEEQIERERKNEIFNEVKVIYGALVAKALDELDAEIERTANGEKDIASKFTNVSVPNLAKQYQEELSEFLDEDKALSITELDNKYELFHALKSSTPGSTETFDREDFSIRDFAKRIAMKYGVETSDTEEEVDNS